MGYEASDFRRSRQSMVIEVPETAVYDAFESVPNVVYSKENIEKNKKQASILGQGDSRSMMFQQRYYMILQQLFRDSKFIDVARGKRGADFPTISFFGKEEAKQEPVTVNGQSLFLIHSGEDTAWRFEITPAESLPGSTGIKVVFGMLSRGENGKLCIEDIHQSVPVKIESMEATDDMITENMFILAKGEMIDEVFNVYQMTLPPVPARSLCEASINLFGGPTELTEDLVINTVGLSPEDSSIAVLSNVVLDNPETIDKLNLLFTGFEECDAVPQAFVLMGNFSSAPFNPFSGDSLRSLQRSFDQFGQLLARHPVTLERARIILVPGPTEPGYGLYPQPALPDALVRGLSSRFPNVTLGSNPCRIRFYNRQITVFSGDNMQRLRRGTLVAVQDRDSEKEANMLVRCIMSQMHLLPGTARNHAAVWEYDTALRIYPPPHALFLSDGHSDSFEKSVDSDTVFVSMPHFSSATTATGEFQLYSPSSNETSPSSV